MTRILKQGHMREAADNRSVLLFEDSSRVGNLSQTTQIAEAEQMKQLLPRFL